MKPTVAIAGAGGYVGRWFIDRFKDRYRIVALSRSDVAVSVDSEVEWRKVEMFSITSTSEALQGVDFALYLIHSMGATTRLNQGSFEDTDLLLADNFVRAAEINQLKQIIYLGGIIPEGKKEEDLSAHLRSRLEVEKTLGSRSVPMTAVRAGIIVGPGGSSFSMIQKLVQKLPIMVCPSWTGSKTQAISLQNTLDILQCCLGNPRAFGKIYEIGSPEVLTYKSMLQQTADVLGKKRFIFSVPFLSVGFSKLWVGYFGESPAKLVAPLIESLKHDMLVAAKYRFDLKEIAYDSYSESVRYALAFENDIPKLPRFKKNERIQNTVRSIQRLPNTRHQSALWIANRYKVWLPTFFRFLIRAEENSRGDLGFFLAYGKKPMLQLTWIPDRSDIKRQLFYISGGWLVKRFDYGWLEFREVLGGKYVISAIHEFVPRLPWFVYILTQAKIHLWVMRSFRKYLEQYKGS
ncbi:NAD(P)H-binding protein [Mariniradius sediminis]|uniref:Epimerase n=1 Tax=Mariniradius sediminis TaxID=2909237 RepID=A0ABS9BXG2_9BACT|nr:NAD(P)H-binding protein [Mariniradius sediminis]MCF1752142.1 epimerase [Mariniradius sediminis]